MVFQSSIRNELARSFGATVVVLITIVLTIVLIRTLGQASKGSINPQDVMLFMAYSAIGRAPTILTLALFVSLVSVLSRMYRDSEMVVWFTSGQSLGHLLPPLFRFSWPILLVIGVSALFLWPWANQQTRDMQLRYEARGDLDRVAAGQFQESSSGNRVFFIDRESAQPQGSTNIFIAANEKGKSSVTTAQSGRVETRDDAQFVLLENGQRLENETGGSALTVSEFAQYGVRTGNSAALGPRPSVAKLMSTRELIESPLRSARSELAWRIGLALSAINCVLLAVALSSVNPRGGRSWNLLLTLLAFVVYNNLLNLGQSWIQVGLVGLGEFLMLLHGGVLVLAAIWLAKRHFNWSLRGTWRTSPPTPLAVRAEQTPR